MNSPSNGNLRFGDCELDSHSGKLYRDGAPVRLQPQPLRVLTVLVERRGEIVSREELRERVWGEATYVEFDQGLNYCIRQVRLALRDNASAPRFVETLPKQGYRFIAAIEGGAELVTKPEEVPESRRARRSYWIAAAAALLLMVALYIYGLLRSHPSALHYAQITDFVDSATDPVLSPDGRKVAFIRGDRGFLTADQIWIKMLPDGEPKRLTDDPRLKYGIAFSPDGSKIAFSVLEPPSWSTYTVPVAGGRAEKLLDDAAGLQWLDAGHLLFSTIREGQHMGVVRSTLTRSDLKELYFPEHQRAMAHYSYPSPDRKSALVAQMDSTGAWAPCELISLDGRFAPHEIGPRGPCYAAAWSHDGTWMYFNAEVASQTHIWGQRVLGGEAEQITSGPTEEEGIAVAPGGRSLITSIGVHENSIWLHDPRGERSLSSEGEVVKGSGRFTGDGKALYYLLRRPLSGTGARLWRLNVDSGVGEETLPGVSTLSFDISSNGREVVYAAGPDEARSELWIAPLDHSKPPRRIGSAGDAQPHFGVNGKIIFRFTHAGYNYLGEMNEDNTGRARLVDFPVNLIFSVSPAGHWVMAGVPRSDARGMADTAIPLDGGSPRPICTDFCVPLWSPNGEYLFVRVRNISRNGPGQTLAIPVEPGERLAPFPAGGLQAGDETRAMPGAQIINRAEIVPGIDPAHYAWINYTVHRNLYRISLP